MYRFSIIVPVYNAEKTLSTCLNSILHQTFVDYELIIVNDGSNDNSWRAIGDMADKLPQARLRIINQPNSGAGAARNAGIEAVNGEYIVFVDADDYIDNEYLQRTDETIRRDNSDVVFVDIIREDEHGRVIRYERMSDYRNLSNERMIRWQLTGKLPWGGVRKIVRASIVKDNHLRYATSIIVGEESIYSFNILQHAPKISFQSRSFYHYVENSASLTSNDVVDNSQSVFLFMTQYLRETGQDVKYAKTINAMAITTAAVACNVAFSTKSFLKGYKEAKLILQKFRYKISGEIDKDALDGRVRLLAPFLKKGIILPVWIASRLNYVYRRCAPFL